MARRAIARWRHPDLYMTRHMASVTCLGASVYDRKRRVDHYAEDSLSVVLVPSVGELGYTP